MDRRTFLKGLLATTAAVPVVRALPVIPKTGSIPIVNGGTGFVSYAELVKITQEAFLPKMQLQLYETHPVMPAWIKGRD